MYNWQKLYLLNIVTRANERIEATLQLAITFHSGTDNYFWQQSLAMQARIIIATVPSPL